MPSDAEPVAVVRCGVPNELRDDAKVDALMDLVPEDQNGLPCSGGFHPFDGCAFCVFRQQAEGWYIPTWVEVQVDTDFEWCVSPPPAVERADHVE